MKPGDPIRFTDYIGSGILLEIKGDTVLVRDELGIELTLNKRQIVPVFKPDAALHQFRKKNPQEKNVSVSKKLHSDIQDPWTENRKIPKVKDSKGIDAGIAHKLEADLNLKKNKVIQSVPNERSIDLHLHEILENTSGMSDGEKLSYQLDYFQKEVRKAENDRIRTLIVIHGVGKGTLKTEVRRLLHNWGYDRVSDASWKMYGTGATRVELIRRGL